MSRKSGPKKSSTSGGPAIEGPSLNEERLDLDKILNLNPWKDIDKYDKQEAGQIQEVLVQFNDMVLNDKKNKQRSMRKRAVSTSSTKATGSNEIIEEESRKNAVLENVACTENTNVIQNIEKKVVEAEREEKLEEKKEKSIKEINRKERKSIEKKRDLTSSMKAMAGNKAAAEGQSIERQKMSKEKFEYWLFTSLGSNLNVDTEENISPDCKDDNEGTESFDEAKRDEENLEQNKKIIIKAVGKKNHVVNDTSADHPQKIQTSVSPLAPRNELLRNREAIELPNDETSCDDNYLQYESILAGHLTNETFNILDSPNILLESLHSDSENKKNNVLKRVTGNLAKLSSTMTAQTENAVPEKEEIAECKNNKCQSKYKRKHHEKMAKAFEKFGKQFVKYSNKIEDSPDYKTELIDVSIDSESDSYSSNSSSGSSDSDDSSSSSSNSSSRCSCCSSSSSGSSYTSYTSCSCSSCCGDDEYSEYTLASSSSTYPGSDESTYSSTE